MGHEQEAGGVRAAADGGQPARVAGVTLAALFAEGPFARLEEFEDVLVRERTQVRSAFEGW